MVAASLHCEHRHGLIIETRQPACAADQVHSGMLISIVNTSPRAKRLLCRGASRNSRMGLGALTPGRNTGLFARPDFVAATRSAAAND
jgi:hypothetical protein